MKSSDIRSKDDAGLMKELRDIRKAQFSLRMQLATQQLTNTSQISMLRKDVARIKTIQRERALGK